MRRWTGLMLGLVAAAAACAPVTNSSVSQMTGESDIYYPNQAAAEAALAQFDRDNPGCEVWTNWQRLCVRGRTGQPHCFIDTRRPVRPSTPFCAFVPSGAGSEVFLAAQIDSRESLRGRSVFRYCNSAPTPGTNDFAGSWDNEGRFLARGACAFRANRPFSRRRSSDFGRGIVTSVGGNGAEHPPIQSFDAFVGDMRSWCAVVSVMNGQNFAHDQRQMTPNRYRSPHDHFPVQAAFCGVRR